MKRTLVLRRESLTELTTEELDRVVAGHTASADPLTCLPPTLTMCPDFYCTGTC